MPLTDWFLDAAGRGNPDAAVQDWTVGNLATPLVHGSTCFAALLGAISEMREGDLLLFTDWRGDPDQRLDEGTGVSAALCEAARRGVDVRGLVWRSHLDKLSFSADENRHFGEEIEQAGGECLLDMRVRTGGSHHQTFVVLRHPGRPELDVAFVGGIDLCHSRRDDEDHGGDQQRQPMAKVYGPRPPWHDARVELRGPVVGDVETVFRERWEDPRPLNRNPVHLVADLLRREDEVANPLPEKLPDPAAAGPPSQPHRPRAGAVADEGGRWRPRRRPRHREPLRHADLRARQGVRHRRRLSDQRLRQRQPAVVEPRLRAHRCRAR